jgi:2,3-bisphosphoglycerate-independent phosphoglycerate mutase
MLSLFKRNTLSKQAVCPFPPLVLLVMDGFGIAPPTAGNAITLAKTPTYDRFLKEYPHGELIASGESIGLPANEVGNTEVGHLTLGAGSVIYQDLVRINRAVKDQTLDKNPALLQASLHVSQTGGAFHIMGLIGNGCVHSSVEHLDALIDFCAKQHLPKVFLHLFTDGRDSAPDACLAVMKKIEQKISALPAIKVASVSGRYYAMDRDRRWERIEKAYKAMVLGDAPRGESGSKIIEAAYANKVSDEFIEPTMVSDVNGPIGVMNDGDAAIFYNFRIDRPRQLTMALVMPDFETLKQFDFGFDPQLNKAEGTVAFGNTFARNKILNNFFMVTMTEYQEHLPVSAIAFGPQTVKHNMAYLVAQAGLSQLHMSESEKERFVTYYFNGMQEITYPLQETVIVPSPKVPTYDKKPEMSLWPLLNEFKKKMSTCQYQFTIMNWANADMVAHTGNLAASIEAIEHIDKALAEMERIVLDAGGTLAITADHGNAEELITYPGHSFYYTMAQGSVNTEHSSNKVPFILINQAYKGKPVQLAQGILCDVAPTILPFLGLSASPDMNGRNLLVSS